jgi:magnesium chelatase family protein
MNALTRPAAIARVRTFAFVGIEAVPVEVQVQISAGLPAFLVVGLPDKAVAEARERVRAALSAMGLALPPRRLLINMETGRTTVARAAAHVTYPARFQLIAAMNPCRCGHLGDAAQECGRAPRCGEDYQGRISGPVLDRMDLTVEVSPASAAELARAPAGEPSAAVAARVAHARAAQRARYGEAGPASNAEADPKDIRLAADAQALAEQAMERLRLSPRGYTRVLRVGRTIADLAGAETVARMHVAEALAFRHRAPGRGRG